MGKALFGALAKAAKHTLVVESGDGCEAIVAVEADADVVPVQDKRGARVVAQAVAGKAGNLAKTASSKAAPAKRRIGRAAHTVAGRAGDIAKTASSKAVPIKQGVGVAAGVVAEGAGTIAKAASSKAAPVVDAIKDHSPEAVVKRAKVASFRDGINEGASLMANKAYAYSFALVALASYVARCDGSYDAAEEEQIRKSLRHIYADEGIPEAIKDEFDDIASNENLTFDDVAEYLDEVVFPTVENLRVELNDAIEADGHVSPEEEAVRQRFEEYVESRRAAAED